MRLGLAVSLAALTGAAAGAAAVAALLGPSEVVATADPVLAEVVEATVGRTIALNAVATRAADRPLYNRLAGTVTSVGDASGPLSGKLLYHVDGEPVVVVRGGVPFWRDLQSGAVGPDVEQLERLLVEMGFLDRADEQFDRATRDAVGAWRAHIGVVRDGPVPLGRLLAVPAEMAGIKLGELIAPGAVLQGGEVAAVGLAGEPQFTIPLTQSQVALLPTGTAVSLRIGDAIVDGQISRVDEINGTPIASLANVDGRPLCSSPCSQVPSEPTSTVPVEVVLVPKVSGAAVPVAAIRTAADGSTFVTTPDGHRVPVEVRGEGDGLAIIDGVELGVQVVVTDPSQTRSG